MSATWIFSFRRNFTNSKNIQQNPKQIDFLDELMNTNKIFMQKRYVSF